MVGCPDDDIAEPELQGRVPQAEQRVPVRLTQGEGPETGQAGVGRSQDHGTARQLDRRREGPRRLRHQADGGGQRVFVQHESDQASRRPCKPFRAEEGCRVCAENGDNREVPFGAPGLCLDDPEGNVSRLNLDPCPATRQQDTGWSEPGEQFRAGVVLKIFEADRQEQAPCRHTVERPFRRENRGKTALGRKVCGIEEHDRTGFIRVKRHGEPILNVSCLPSYHQHLAVLRSGASVIIQAFLRWVETAKATDRARAASALARAYCSKDGDRIDRHAADMAMTFLLDDPSPKVRQALAEALAAAPEAPRPIILSLAEDQPEIAFTVVTRSTVLADDDLIDLAARGTAELRAFIASRSHVSRPVSAAISEVGGVPEVMILLENAGADLSRRTLKRIADRLGDVCSIRNLLLERQDLPADARQVLVEHVGAALKGATFLQAVIGVDRLQRVARTACETATIDMAGLLEDADIQGLVEELRVTGRLTPALLVNALCHGRVDFFATAIVALTELSEKRVRSILSDGRPQVLQVLFESGGLDREVSALFAEAILIWRRERRQGSHIPAASIASVLVHRLRTMTDSSGLSECVEKLAIAEQRRFARDFAIDAARQAA